MTRLPAPLSVTQALELLVLFVLLPFVVAGGVIAFVSWRSQGGPAPVRISELLAGGEPAEGEVLAVSPLGSILDARPMLEVRLRVRTAGSSAPFDLDVTQSVPRRVASRLRQGDVVELRVSADHSAGALVLGPQAAGGPGGH